MLTHSQEKSYDAFLQSCARLKSVEHFKYFFELFFTPEERKDISNRFLIIKELLNGEKTQRTIAKEHHISIAQITRGSNMLKVLNADAIKLINKVFQHGNE
jgi:TrpR family trp operon transcriptional repressor